MAEREALPEAVLEVIEPDGSRRMVQVIESPFLIGRGTEAGNHLQLADKRISRRCASIIYSDGAFRLEDSGQRHGVFVNGEKIEGPRALHDSDAITFGVADSHQLTFHTGKQQESLSQLLSRLEQASTMEGGARDLRQLNLLLEAANLLQSHLPMEEVLGAMVDRAIAITDADRGLLLEGDSAGGLHSMLARQQGGRRLSVEGIAPSQTAIARALEKRHSVVEEDVAQAASALREAQSIIGQQLRSVIAVPLSSLAHLRATEATHISAPGQVLGVLYLDSRRPAAFSRLERQILDALALEVAGVLDNARLMQKERERRRLEQEFAIASDIQQALLPKVFDSFPPHFQVTGINYPCLAVGGDYFDLMEISPERTAFVIADVSGKGLGAALVTAMLQGTFSAMTLGQEPASIFAHVNRFMCDHSQVERYATLFFGILDKSGRLEYINAGHLPTLLLRDGSVSTAFPSESLPLGLFRHAEFKTSYAQLQPGDTMVLFTDGINEATNPKGEQLSLEGLQAIVAKHTNVPVQELQAGILADLKEFTRGSYQADDVTLLVIRYKGE